MNEEILKTFTQYKEKYRDSKFYTFLNSVDINNEEKLKAIIKFLENDSIMEHIDSQKLDELINGMEKGYRTEYYKMLYDLVIEIYKKEGKEPQFDLDPKDIKDEERDILFSQYLKYVNTNRDQEIIEKFGEIHSKAKFKIIEQHHKMLCDLVSTVYGKDAEDILLERPRITIADIPNFYIFDDKIRDMIGYGGVHTFMNYDMPSSPIISKIAQNPELIKYYKEFEKVTKDMFPPSAVGLEQRLQSFNKHANLIRQIMDSTEPEKYIGNMKTYIYNANRLSFFNDPDVKKRFDQLFNVQTIQDLDGFEDKMNALLDEMVETGRISKHRMLEFRYLGTTSQLNEEQYIREYDEHGSEFLGDNEVNLIELSSLHSKISKMLEGMKDDDMDIMGEYVDKAEKELYDLIRSEQTQFSSFQTEQIRKKIVEEYKTRYMKSLFPADNIAEQAHETEQRIQEGTDNQDSQHINVRRVIKKKDGNLYFADHMESIDGKIKTYQDYIDDGEYITREYTYEGNKQFISKDWEYFDEKYRAYIIGDYTIRFKYSEEDKEYVFDAYSHDRKVFRDRDEHVARLEDIIESGKIVKQYNPEEHYQLGAEDSEFFIVDKVNSANLMLTAIRNGHATVTSINLQGKIGKNDDRIMIEKEFEGGQSTRSFYYHYNRGMASSFDVALGFTDMNPNGIIGFDEKDAMVTHELKQLNPTMSSMPISSIMESTCNDGEIAALRYEWNIDDIRPRNKWWKNTTILCSK